MKENSRVKKQPHSTNAGALVYDEATATGKIDRQYVGKDIVTQKQSQTLCQAPLDRMRNDQELVRDGDPSRAQGREKSGVGVDLGSEIWDGLFPVLVYQRETIGTLIFAPHQRARSLMEISYRWVSRSAANTVG